MVAVTEDLPSLHGLSVLLLEDNEDFREALESILQLCGAHTTPASRLSEARNALEAQQPHVIVADMVLPDGTGAEFVEWLRQLPFNQGGALAVVAVTAFPHNFPAVTTRGFAAYFVKPVNLADLCWTIASILGRGSRPTPSD